MAVSSRFESPLRTAIFVHFLSHRKHLLVALESYELEVRVEGSVVGTRT